jgi:Rrf2 family protein
MLRLSKKADYALISLGYLAERPAQVVSAREIAERCRLPLPLLMNILKVLHQRGILKSSRGASGGYRIASDLGRLSLLELSGILENADGDRAGEMMDKKRFALHGPAQALQYRIVRFMRDVTVADLVMPGRRIDVPLERVGFLKHNIKPPCQCEQHQAQHSGAAGEAIET